MLEAFVCARSLVSPMRIARTVVFACLAPVAAVAETAPLMAPQGDVVLEVTGDLAVTNAEGLARFDLPMLQDLGEVTVSTSTLWTDGVQQFTGVPLHRLLERVGARGSVINATAINDYWVDIPMSDAVEDGPIVAFEQNGQPLSVRDMGPLWIIYPYDSDVRYQTEVIYARSVWQLIKLDVRP